MRRNGLALIVVIGILGVLAVLAVAFVAMAQLERRASEQRVNAARAYLLARSGIEDALARLELGQDPAYGGENWDGSEDGLLSAFEAEQEVYRRTGAGTPADVETCPVKHAMRPSFFAQAQPMPNPMTQVVEERRRGYSGVLSGDHAVDGNAYVLRVKAGGRHNEGIFINGGDPAALPAEGYNAVLRRILGTLAKAIDEGIAPIDGLPVGEADGWRLIDARPPGGWESFEQVRELALSGSFGSLGAPGLGATISQVKLEVLQPYLALSAWVDRKVIAPNATEDMAGKTYPSWGGMKLAHRESRPGSRAPDFERIRGRIVGRAPVSLAWASRHRPVLIALLAGLRGLYLDETTADAVAIGTSREAALSLDWTPADDCHLAAAQIMGLAGGIGTWHRWNGFCDGLVLNPDLSGLPSSPPSPDPPPQPPPVGPFLAWKDGQQAKLNGFKGALADPRWIERLNRQLQAKRDLLKAHFNPNGDLNKFNPNPSLWRSVDKQDLLGYATEFSLLPLGTAGDREVSSVGRVLGSGGQILAARALAVLARGPSVARLTTQKEFVCEDLGSLEIAGDERDFRLPGRGPFITPSQGTGKTWGHALPGLEDRGASLQTYPEPTVDDGNGLSIHPADYDGNVQLATIETRTDEMFEVQAPIRDMKMLARFDDGMDLDVADSGVGSCRADVALAVAAEAGNSLLHALKPGTLYPDGCYCEKDRVPSYPDRGNADGFHGVMSFWLKTNHEDPRDIGVSPIKGGTYPVYTRGHAWLVWTNYDPGHKSGWLSNSPNQFFCLVEVPPAGAASCPLAMHFEIGHSVSDTGKEQGCKIPKRELMTPHRWRLATAFWDFRGLAKHDRGELVVDAGVPPDLKGSPDTYHPGEPADGSATACDITLDDSYGTHRISFGHPRSVEMYGFDSYGPFGRAPDATFDDFAIYDFGGAQPLPGQPAVILPAAQETLASPEILAANRFKEGRYYKESAYDGLGDQDNTAAEYFSPPLALGSARVICLAWTQIVPRGLRTPPLPDALPIDPSPTLPTVMVPVTGGQFNVPVHVEADTGSLEESEAGWTQDPQLPDGRISFEFVNAACDRYLQDAHGQSIDQRFTDDALSRIDRRVGSPFRLHAVFQPNLADPENTPILDPLALDDVTLVYEAAGGPRLVQWESDAE